MPCFRQRHVVKIGEVDELGSSVNGAFGNDLAQRNLAVQFGILGKKHFAHATGTELVDNPIMTDRVADHRPTKS